MKKMTFWLRMVLIPAATIALVLLTTQVALGNRLGAGLPAEGQDTLLFVSQAASSPALQRLSILRELLPGGPPSTFTRDAMRLADRCKIGAQSASPNGRWVALHINCQDGAYTQVLEAGTGRIRRPTNWPQASLFLDWAPDGNSVILRTDPISHDQIILVNLDSGATTHLNTPPYAYDAAFSPDGQQVLYPASRGLGWGGELWLTSRDGSAPQLLVQERQYLVVSPRWSPQGNAIAYIRMPDTNIPFTPGELWLADGAGQNRRMIAAADAGHGYPPAWSPDGKTLAFVGRENPRSVRADNLPEALESNIYLFDIQTNAVRPLTQFKGALTDSIAWSPDGTRIAFRTTAGGGSDIWVADVNTGRMQPITSGLEANYPAWLGK